jgi:hypothetical protein
MSIVYALLDQTKYSLINCSLMIILHELYAPLGQILMSLEYTVYSCLALLISLFKRSVS